MKPKHCLECDKTNIFPACKETCETNKKWIERQKTINENRRKETEIESYFHSQARLRRYLKK